MRNGGSFQFAMETHLISTFSRPWVWTTWYSSRWVLCSSAGFTLSSAQANLHVTTFHTLVVSGDDILRRFWEVKETHACHFFLSIEERTVVRHFEDNHSRTEEGRFVVPLPKDPSARSQAVRRFLSLECSRNARSYFREFDEFM